MAKVSPKDQGSKINRKQQKRRLKATLTNNCSRKEYVKPGALAHQLRYSRTAITPSTQKSCTDLAKKRVVVLDNKKPNKDEDDAAAASLLVVQNDVIANHIRTPPMMSPERITFTPMPPAAGPLDVLRQTQLPTTPKTPRIEHHDSESRLESLPMDLLVKLLCHLHHDQLRPVFHVSQKIRKAVILARQFHFNYTTPDRARQEMLRTMTPLPTEHWPFVRGHGKGIPSSPHTPRAPRHGPRPPSRYKGIAEVRQITAVLFQESALPSRCIVPPGLPKSTCKSFPSNRALFCEDELCQAVAQNKLR